MIAEFRGLSVWTTTRPGISLRPARPATWAMSWKVRSSARKSGMESDVSALRIPTRVTPGKSSPLAIIWVPSISLISPLENRSRMVK